MTEDGRRPRLNGLKAKLDAIHRSAIVPKDLELTEPIYDPAEFAGKTILITGVSHFNGFGYETVKKFIEMGAGAVAFNYRVETDEVRAVIADLNQRAKLTGTQVIPIQADISKIKQAEGLVGKVVAQTGRLDVFIDNAGKIAIGLLAEQTPDQVVENAMTNVVGFQIILGEAVRQMESARAGRVVSIMSVAADGAFRQSQYGAAKAYRFGAMRSGATEALLRRTGVTFVCVAPGFSSTAMTSVIGETERPTLMRMIGQTEEVPSSEVAKYTIFAASSHLPDELNGQVIPVYKPMKAPVALGGK